MYLHSPSSDDKDHGLLLSRQKPGLACEGCRKRNFRRDRVHPQCGVCSDSGVVCTFSLHISATPGPKDKDTWKPWIAGLIDRWFNSALPQQTADRNDKHTDIFPQLPLNIVWPSQQAGNLNDDPFAVRKTEQGAMMLVDPYNDEAEPPMLSDSTFSEGGSTTTLDPFAYLSPQGLLVDSQGGPPRFLI